MSTKTASKFAKAVDLRFNMNKVQRSAVAIKSKADEEKRELSAEENERLTKLETDYTDLDNRLSAIEGPDDDDDDTDDEDRDDDDSDMEDDKKDDSKRSGDRFRDETREKRTGRHADSRRNPTRSERSNGRVKTERRNGESESRFRDRERRAQADYVKACGEYLIHGKSAVFNSRALQADVDFAGGYLVLPEKMSNKILKRVDDLLFMRNMGNVISVTDAASLGIGSLETDAADTDWTAEITTVAEDTGPTLGKRSLRPNPMRKMIKVSEALIRKGFDASFQSADDKNGQGGKPDDLVTGRMSFAAARTMEKGYLTGNGVGRPLGVFTASSRGINTDRDVATGSTSGVTYDGLLAAYFGVKEQYKSRADWLFHRNTLLKIMQLKDSNGRPILDIATLPNQPSSIWGRPVHLSEFAPSTYTSNAYIGIFGDFSFYQIVDSQDITVKRLDELFAQNAQIGFIVSAESDGMPVLSEAFARLKCA